MALGKLQILLIVMTLGLLLVGVVSAKTAVVGDTYTPTTKTTCDIYGRCTTTLYGGTTYGIEDSKWKHVDDLKSWKNSTNIQCLVAEDDDTFVECLDYNATDLKIKVKIKHDGMKNKDIKIKEKNIDGNYNEKNKKIKLANLTDEVIETIKWGETKEIHIGETSTNITLNDTTDEVLDDTYISEDSPTSNLDYIGFMIIHNYTSKQRWGMWKFNISSLPDYTTIESSTLSIFLDGYGASGDDKTNATFHRIHDNHTWTETSITWNNFNSGSNYNLSYSSMLEMSGGMTEDIYYNIDVSDIIKEAEEDEDSNVSILMKPWNQTGSACTTCWYDFEVRENGVSSRRPYLEIQYNVSKIVTLIDSDAINDGDATYPSHTDSLCFGDDGSLNAVWEANGDDIWFGNSSDGYTWDIKEIYDGSNPSKAGIICGDNGEMMIYFEEGVNIDSYNTTNYGVDWSFYALETGLGDSPSCTYDSKGDWHCCFIEGNQYDLHYKNATVELELKTDDADWCDIDVGDDDEIYIGVIENTGDDVFLFSSLNWSQEDTVSLGTSVYLPFSIVMNGTETFIAYIDNVDLHFCNGTFDGSYSCGQIDGVASYNPKISLTNAGHIIITYQSGNHNSGDVFWANSTDGGASFSVRNTLIENAGWLSTAYSAYNANTSNINDSLHYVYVQNDDVYYSYMPTISGEPADESPTVDHYSPTNGSLVGTASQNFTANFTDDSGVDNATIWVYWTNGTLFNQTTTVIGGLTSGAVGTVITLVEGIFDWFYSVIDDIGQETQADDNWTIELDTTNPTFTYIPDNQTLEYSDVLGINFTGNDSNFEAYYINDSDYTINSTGWITNNTMPVIGTEVLNVSINDSVNNTNWTTFSVTWEDTTAPIITSPANQSLNSTQSLAVDFDSDDYSALGDWNVNNSNFTINSTGYLSNNSVMVNGNTTLNISLNDTYNNTNWVYYWVNITEIIGDIEDPVINLTIPVNITNTTDTSINYSANFSDDVAVDNATLWVYFTNGTLFNETFTDIADIATGVVSTIVGMVDGVFNWWYDVIDTAGKSTTSENRTITIDTTAPSVTPLNPDNGLTVYTGEQVFGASFVDALNSLTNGTLYIWNSSGIENNTNVSALSGGSDNANNTYTLPSWDTYTWNYYGCDSLGNCGWGTNRTITFEEATIPIDWDGLTNCTSIINASSGERITKLCTDGMLYMKSDNGTAYKCGPTNVGGWSCSGNQ